MSDVCQELQNIKYQTMLLNHNSKIYETTPNIDNNNIEFFLESEKISNKNKPWSKLSKASKLKKLNEYVEEHSKKEKLNEEEIKTLKLYLMKCLERKKLQRQKMLHMIWKIIKLSLLMVWFTIKIQQIYIKKTR